MDAAEQEEKETKDETLVVFRIKKVQTPFFRRMIRHFYEGQPRPA